MVFSSTVFLFMFLPLVLGIYYILLRRSRKLQNVFLLIASLFFYAWGEPNFVLIMGLSIVANYIFGLLVDKLTRGKKVVLLFTVLFNLSILFVFKYLVFTLNNINTLFNSSLHIPNIALPIGISFFTFQAMSYVFDVYYGMGGGTEEYFECGIIYLVFSTTHCRTNC